VVFYILGTIWLLGVVVLGFYALVFDAPPQRGVKVSVLATTIAYVFWPVSLIIVIVYVAFFDRRRKADHARDSDRSENE
jgi:uncharacterized membrane protein